MRYSIHQHKYLLGMFILLLIAVSSQFVSGQEEPLSLTVGVYQLPPLVQYSKDGQYSGLVIDVVDDIAQKEGWQINYSACPWNNCLDRLNDGSIDMLCLIADIPERRELFDFNQEPVYLDWGQIWTRPDSEIKNLHDLNDCTVAGIKNEVFTSSFKNILTGGSFTCNLVEVDGYETLVELVKNHAADAVVLNRMFDPSFLNVKLAKTNIIFSPTSMGFGFPKNADLNETVIPLIDKHLNIMKSDNNSPYYSAIEKWLSDEEESVHWIWYVFIFFVIVLVVIIVSLYYWTQKHRLIKYGTEIDLNSRYDAGSSDPINREMSYFKLFNTFNDGLLACDLSVDGVLGRITTCNKQFCLISGRSEEQLHNLRIIDLIPEDGQDRTHAIISQLVGSRDILFQSKIMAPDGLIRDVEIHATLIEHAEQWKIVAVVRDVTDRTDLGSAFRSRVYELESQYEEQNRYLRTVIQELEMFAGTVSHDLQSPLKTIEETMRRFQKKYSNGDNDARKDMDQMVHLIQRMNRLVRGILEYTRLSRKDNEMSGVGLAQICSEVLLQSDGLIREHKARVKIERPMPRVLAHPNTLVRVVQNLLTNAVKFVEYGKIPEVIFRCEDKGSTVRLWVIDNGIGIAPEYQTRIFEVFQRLHGSEEYPGNGLGLAIVKRAIERMNGRIGMISEVGEGSRFWIELPADPAETKS